MTDTHDNSINYSLSTLILWNDDKFLKALESKLNDSVSIKTEEELIKNLSKPDIRAIIILIELKWNNKYYSDFFGLGIAQRIRREFKITAPIIFCSFLQPELFFYSEKQKNISSKVQILKASGSYFIPLPFTIKAIKDKVEETKLLSAAALIDVVEKCCNPIGTVIDLLHPLKSAIKNISHEEFNKLQAKIESFITQEQKEILDYNGLVTSANDKLSKANWEGFKSEVQQLERNCIEYFNSNRENNSFHEKKNNITVLLLEDDIKNCERIKEELAKPGRDINIIYFQDSYEALKIIQNDTTNKYCVIIADWRLYKNNSFDEWQDYQGYKFLEEASKNHFFAPIALTSMNDSSVHEIRNNLSINIDLFKKEHLIVDNNWEILADIIRQKHNDMVDLIGSRPSSPEWYKTVKRKQKGVEVTIASYNEQYREVRKSNEWDSFEREVSVEANELWDNFKKIFNDPRPSVLPLKELGIEINHTIRNVLIVRRIWSALWFKRNSIDHRNSIKAIYDIINDGEYDQYSYDGPDENNSNKDNVFASSLAIKSKELSKELLPEERRWLLKNKIPIIPSKADDSGNDTTEEKEPTDAELGQIEREKLDEDDSAK